MANSIAKILDRFFDNKMEDFETAFPAVIDVVNDDGTVNVRPSVRNCLRNMQMEPLKDGKLMAIRNVPVLWIGTKAVHVEYELDAGDTVLCISSSRDIRNWKKETWGEDAALPMSFSGNDLLNLLAIPMRRINEDASTTISVDREGNVKINAKKVELSAENVEITVALSVDGDIETTGEISSDGNISSKGDVEATGNVKGADFSTPTLSFLGHTHATAATGSPTPPTPYAPPSP